MTGSPQSAATLTISRGPGAGRRFDIGAAAVTIGRHEQCDVMVEDTWVSRRHARIEWSGTGYIVEDLSSTNGTYINGARVVGPRALDSGDTLRLGEQVELVFQVSAPAPWHAAPVLPGVAASPGSSAGPPEAHAALSKPVPVQEGAWLRQKRTWVWALLGLLLCLFVAGGAYYLLADKGEQVAEPDLPQAVIGEELIVGDTKVLVAHAQPLQSIEVDIGFGPSNMTPDEPGMLFLDVKMTLSNLQDQSGVLEGEQGKDSIFALVGGDGKAYGAFGYMSDPAIEANGTRELTKTFVIHEDAMQGAKLYIKDIFSDQRGIILLSK